MHARAHTHRTTHYYRHRHHTLRKWKANRLLMNQSSWLSIYPSCCLHHSKGRFSMFWSVFSLSLSSSRFAVSVFVVVLSPPLSVWVCMCAYRSVGLPVCMCACRTVCQPVCPFLSLSTIPGDCDMQPLAVILVRFRLCADRVLTPLPQVD